MTENLKEFSQMEKKTDNGWTQVVSALNEDLNSLFRINVTGMSGEKYIRAVATDSGSEMDVASPAICVKIGTVLEVKTHPWETETKLKKS